MDKAKLSEKLGEAFGDKTVKVIMPKQFLANLSDLLVNQNKELLEQIKANNISPELVEENKKTQALLIELKDAVKENRVDKVEVTNLKDYPEFPAIPQPKEIKIPEYPKEINLLEPKWYERVQDKFIGFLIDGFQMMKKSFASDLDRHKEKQNAFAVRLVDAEGNYFYNAMFTGGGGGGNVGVTNFPADYPLPAAQLLTLTPPSKAEDSAHVSGDLGIMALAVRKDDLSASEADGDYTSLPVSVHSAIKGVDVHVVGDSDKYVRGNVAEGAAVSDPVYGGFRDGSGNVYGMRGDATNGLDVDVTRVIPGTTATALGKAKGSTVGATDTGVGVFGKLRFDDAHTSDADGSYDNFSLTSFHELRTRDQRAIDLANCNSSADYTELSNDTINKGNSTNHIFGTGAIKFDKANGAANTVYAGVSDSFTAFNAQEMFEAGGFVGLSVYLPSLTNVVNVFLRIGTDSTNYNCWTWPTDNLTAATWLNLRTAAASPDYARNAGNGWSTSAIAYVAFGVEFTAQDNVLADIRFDHVHLVGGRVTASDTNATISSSISSPNINILKVGGSVVDKADGATGSGTMRVAIGGAAHDAADAGYPVKIGAKAITALSTATMVAAADRTDLYADEDGVQVVKANCTNNDILMERLSNTDGASTASTVFGATASTYNMITTIVVHNAHATTNGYVDIRDGTAGTVLMTIPLPATGGAVINLPVPLRTSANTALAYDVSAAITTMYISFVGYKSKA